MLPKRAVQVHDLLHRRVKAGQEHVFDDQEAEHALRQRLSETVDQRLLLLLGGVVLGQELLVIVGAGEDDPGLDLAADLLAEHFDFQAVEGLAVLDAGLARDADDLGLKAVGEDRFPVVGEDVAHDRLDPAVGLNDRTFRGIARFDGLALLLGAGGKLLVKEAD